VIRVGRDIESSSVELGLLAAHTSGHAVVGILNNISVNRITLRADPTHGVVGRVEWAHPLLAGTGGGLSRRLRSRAHHQLLNAYLGGQCAESIRGFGWPGCTLPLDYAAPDTEEIIALAELISPHNPWRVIRGSIDHICDFCDFIRDPVVSETIDRLSRVLLAERDLSGEELIRFMAETMQESGYARGGRKIIKTALQQAHWPPNQPHNAPTRGD